MRFIILRTTELGSWSNSNSGTPALLRWTAALSFANLVRGQLFQNLHRCPHHLHVRYHPPYRVILGTFIVQPKLTFPLNILQRFWTANCLGEVSWGHQLPDNMLLETKPDFRAGAGASFLRTLEALDPGLSTLRFFVFGTSPSSPTGSPWWKGPSAVA